jgi:hypothetical protein
MERLDACPEWGDPPPLGCHGLAVVEHFVPYWKQLMELVHPYRDDALVAQDWRAAVVAFDREPIPELRDIWILRWRRLVVDVWRLLDAHTTRVKARPRRPLGFQSPVT